MRFRAVDLVALESIDPASANVPRVLSRLRETIEDARAAGLEDRILWAERLIKKFADGGAKVPK